MFPKKKKKIHVRGSRTWEKTVSATHFQKPVPTLSHCLAPTLQIPVREERRHAGDSLPRLKITFFPTDVSHSSGTERAKDRVGGGREGKREKEKRREKR